MANWAFVENGEIKELHDLLPKNWRNVSGLHLSESDVDFLKSLSWYKVVKQHQEYDETTHKVVGYNHSFVNNTVIETLQIDILEKETFQQKKNIFLEQLRIRRNELLKQSDWTQLADTQKLFDVDTKIKWDVYRQKLRDLPNLYSINDTVDLDQVTFPLF